MVKKLLLLLLLLSPALAEEAIRRFDVELQMQKGGKLLVTERIDAYSEGSYIRHGIYRDLLLAPSGSFSNSLLKIHVLGVTRNGAPEPYFVSRRYRRLRLYLGSRDVYLEPGLHRYVLKYLVSGAMRRRKNKGELLWNLTGNEWRFPIYSLGLRVGLPPRLSAQDVKARVYYGPLGARRRSPLAATGNSLRLSLSEPLPPGSGATLQMQWPLALYRPPPPPPSPLALFSLLGTFLLALFYFLGWLHTGRDPVVGPVIPRFSPPEGVSAPLARYLVRNVSDTRSVSSAIFQLAQQGYLRIIPEKPPVLQPGNSPAAAQLAPELSSLYQALMTKVGGLRLDSNHAAALQGAKTALALRLNQRGREYLHGNSGPPLLGTFATAAIAALLLLKVFGGGFSTLVFTAIISFFYTVSAATMLEKAALLLEEYRLIPGLAPLAKLLGAALLLVVIIVPPLFAGLFIAISAGAMVGLAVALAHLLNVFALYLMPSYTKKGALIRNHLLGLMRYLAVSDAAELKRLGAPPDSSSRLARLIPYAIALGLETRFGKRLEDYLKQHPQEAGNVILWSGPRSFSGTNSFDSASLDQLGGLTNEISNSIRTALARASAGSGGGFSGGGFSGGGAGGGGGGGW